MKRIMLITTVILILVMAIPVVVQAQAKSVITPNNPDFFCAFDYEGSYYYGDGTRVTFEDGTINQQCQLKMVEGTPVSSTTRFVLDYDLPEFTAVCYFTVTPAGNMNVHCHSKD